MFDLELMRRASLTAAMPEAEAVAARAYREVPQGALERLEAAPDFDVPKLTDAEIAALVSDEAKLLVIGFEVTSQQYYEKHYIAPEWPGGQSGVTIGIGYDVGYHTEQQLVEHWTGLIPDTDIATLKAAVGKTGQNAKAILSRFSHVRVPWDMALDSYSRSTIPQFGRLVLNTFPNAVDLKGHCFGALFSLVFNRGSSLSGDRRREMHKIKELMAQKSYDPIPDQFVAMKRIWVNENLPGLLKRRDTEALLFRRGLEVMRQVAAATPAPAVLHEGVIDESRYDGDGLNYSDDEPGALESLEARSLQDQVAWPQSDDAAPDYSHILAEDRALSGTTFEFGSAELELLIDANSFEPSRQYGRFPFCLRGVELVSALTSPQVVNKQVDRPTLTLRDTRPNHRDLRCIIGVYDTTTGRLSGFAASTVPNFKAVTSYYTNRASGNMTPTGRYTFEVGWHMVSQPARMVPGCLVERGRRKAVWRSTDNLTYELVDPLLNDRDTGNNLHPAFGGATQKFSSFGCLVVNGSYEAAGDRAKGTHKGEWAEFRKALGLALPGTGDHGKEFDVVLVTGLEAAIARKITTASSKVPEDQVIARLHRLRQGSRGERVKRLQKALKLPETGVLDHSVAKAIADLQKKDFANKSDAIYSPLMEKHYGFSVFAPAEPVVAMAGAPGGGRPERLESLGSDQRLEALYYEIGLASELARRNPGTASGGKLESVGVGGASPEGISLDLGFMALKSIGAGAVRTFELQLQKSICGEQADSLVDKATIRGNVDAAAQKGVGALRDYLSGLLTGLAFVPRPVADLVVDALFERIVKPATAGIGQSVTDKMDLSANWLCQQWQTRLADSTAPSPVPQAPSPSVPTAKGIALPPPADAKAPAPSQATPAPMGLVSAGAVAGSGDVASLVAQIEKAALAQDAAAVRRFIHDLREYLGKSKEQLPPEASARLLTVLCDTPFMAQLAGTQGPDVYDLTRGLLEATAKRPLDRANVKLQVDTLHARLADARAKLQPDEIGKVLKALRGIKSFEDLSFIGDRLITRDPKVLGLVSTYYAQGLINSGRVFAGLELLSSALNKGTMTTAEVTEANGLIGRGNKQIYVNHIKSASDAAALGETFGPFLARAVECYKRAYDPSRPAENTYHGINYVALLMRAERDRIKIDGGVNGTDAAQTLITAMEGSPQPADDFWTLATLGEAYLAVGNLDKAAEYFGKYAQHPDVDAFALNSTVRQLEEVWQIQAGETGKGAILTGLKSVLAKKENGFVTLAAEERKTLQNINPPQFQQHFESTVQGGSFVNFYFLKRIVQCGSAVMAVQIPMGQSARTIGTGFLVIGSEFSPTLPADKSYMLTNAHVLWDTKLGDGYEDNALTPDNAQIVFESDVIEGRKEIYRGKVIWQSPSSMYDATLVELDRKVQHITPLSLASPNTTLVVTEDGVKGTKLAVLGYPNGGNLSLGVLGSLDQMQGTLVDRGGRGATPEPVFLHYRTPTEPGNSGSPVFEVDNWGVVALHHAGFPETGIPRLGGKPGTQQANEGICIQSIRAAVRQQIKDSKKGGWLGKK